MTGQTYLSLPALRVIPTGHKLRGRVSLPGSKSFTNRAMLMAALASGRSSIREALESDDTRYMASALAAMGVHVERKETNLYITGTGKLLQPHAPLFLGNAGTATRFLTAAVALVQGKVVVDGDEHMRKRPIKPLLDALCSLGVKTESSGGCPPVTVHGTGGFDRDIVEVDANLSSQYLSAILMAAACGRQALTVRMAEQGIGGRGYVDMTVEMMGLFGAEIGKVSPTEWRVQPRSYRPREIVIEPDASAATYLWAAEALTGGCIELGTAPDAFMQPDARAYDTIRMFPHLPAEIDGSQMQDAVPTLAVVAAFNEAPVRFTGIDNLRIKECDRVAALEIELCRIAPSLAYQDHGDLVVTGAARMAGRVAAAEIETYSDHRIAMSLALAGLLVDGITIKDPGCVAKTYPNFWRDLESVGATFSKQ
jgi:3-phosphoshikimate 1-carboxyvinyltransferase